MRSGRPLAARHDRLGRALRLAHHRPSGSDGDADDQRFHLRDARAHLFSPVPERQLSALQSLLALSDRHGFPPGSLPPAVLEAVLERAFGNHDFFCVHEAALELLESLCRCSPWVVPYYRERGLDCACFRRLQQWGSGLPQRALAHAILALTDSDAQCYARMMGAGLFDFALAGLRDPAAGLPTLAWLLTVVQQTIVSPHFDRFEEFANLARMAAVGVAEGPDVLRVKALYILATVILSDDAAARAAASDDAVLSAALEHLDTARISDVGAVLDYLQNFVSLSDEFTLRVLHAGVLERVQDLMGHADASAQARMIDVVSNLAVDPPEATDAVFRSELVPLCLDALQSGEMRVKQAVMRLILNLTAKVPAAMIGEWLVERGVVPVVIGLLDSDNGKVLEDAMRFLLTALSRAEAMNGVRMASIGGAFDFAAMQRLGEIGLMDGPLAQLAVAVMDVVQAQRGAN
jgi:hypothetical protein